MCRRFPLLVVLLFATAPVLAEEFTVASYNIENFAANFAGFREKQAARKTPIIDPKAKAERDEAIREEDGQNQEDQWEIAETILDPAFFPDIMMIQEGPAQSDLTHFNKRWLNSAYETVEVLPTNLNPSRPNNPQTLCVMMKPGFKIIDRKDQYYLEKDAQNERGGRLFARGPVFLKVQTPGGYVFWVGNTHQKSKGIRLPAATQPTTAAVVADEPDDIVPADTEPTTREESESRKELRARMEKEANDWRMREAVRTHQIMKEIEAAGPADVMLVGDMNDDLGMDENEVVVGKDGIAEMIGPSDAKMHLMTQKLADEKVDSFGGYWKPRYRSLIDHVIVTDSLKPKVTEVSIFKGNLARVASDHFPVLVKVNTDGK